MLLVGMVEFELGAALGVFLGTLALAEPEPEALGVHDPVPRRRCLRCLLAMGATAARRAWCRRCLFKTRSCEFALKAEPAAIGEGSRRANESKVEVRVVNFMAES